MNRDQARQLVKNTFKQKFDKGRFTTFIGNLLNDIDVSNATSCNFRRIKDAYKPHVDLSQRIGTYTSPNNQLLDVLVVRLTSQAKLIRTRTAIRNFVADYLAGEGKHAALVAFVSPSENAWRFSYVKMEYATVEKSSGDVGVESRLTPARRFSYLVGPGESCHTAQTRFLDLLQNTQTNPQLEDIEEAFSVEAVTKEFFAGYKDLALEVKEELDRLAAGDNAIGAEFAACQISTIDFAKKLMGQIVFLYFLQKKGWLGVAKDAPWGTGPHNFLRKLADGDFGQCTNFFDDMLEPLFYGTLAKDRGHGAFCERFDCRIPFLNGGLFEPLNNYNWRNTKILLPNRLFTNDVAVEEGITGTGILDVFDRYNFTVNEAEPLEKEVAIDPEMLGKVFENLLEVKERKSKGSFYTPREIVHYMCQESLINYLDTAVNGECDTGIPACTPSKTPSQAQETQTGMSVLPQPQTQTGMSVPRCDIETFIHEGDRIADYDAVKANHGIELPAAIKTHARLLDDKLAAITVCDPAIGSGAFPVGMMQEIVRARSALTPYCNDVHDRTAYHFKRHAIQNCLYGVDIDPGAVEIAKLRLWLSLVVDEEDVQQIKPLPNLDYKVVVGNSLLGIEKTLFNADQFALLEELKPKYFDETDSNKKQGYRQEIDRIIHQLTNGNETFDFEIYFSEVFRHEKKGFDVVIGNPPYVSYGLRGGQKMSTQEMNRLKRRFANSAEYKISMYALFMELGITISCPRGGASCLIVPDSFLLGMYFSKIRSLILKECSIRQIVLLPFSVFGAVVGFSVVYLFERETLRKGEGGVRSIVARCCGDLESGRVRELGYPQAYFSRQRRQKFRLFFDTPSFRIVEKCITGSSRIDTLVRFSSGLIGIDGKEAIVSDEKRGGSWLPGILSGGDVHRYFADPKGSYILFDKARIKSGYKCVNYSAPKLFVRQTGDNLICAYDAAGLLCLNNVHVGNGKSPAANLKFLCGLLNSRLVNFFYQVTSLEAGRVMPQVDIEALDDIPVKSEPAAEGAIAELVDACRNLLRGGNEKAAAAKAAEIDQLVYRLYNLTPEEIAIVEGAG